MSILIADRQPAGAPASAGGRFRGHGRSDGGLGELTDDQLVAAASDPTTAPKLLSTLSYSKVEAVRLAVAGNTSTPVKDLERMMNFGALVRRAALANPVLPARVMAAVATAPRRDDLADLALNPRLPDTIAALCARGPVPAQLMIAGRIGCSATVLDELADSADPRVIDEVLSNPGATRSTRNKAQRRLTMLAANVPGDPRAAAADPTTDADALRALSFSRDEFVRNSVAANPGTPPDVLVRQLSRGRFIRGIALRNPGLPAAAALHAAENARDDDLTNLASNPEASAALLDICSTGGGMAPFLVAAHKNTSPAVFARYALSGNAQLLRTVADNPAAPAVSRQAAAAGYDRVLAVFAAEDAAVEAAAVAVAAEKLVRAAARRRELRAEKAADLSAPTTSATEAEK